MARVRRPETFLGQSHLLQRTRRILKQEVCATETEIRVCNSNQAPDHPPEMILLVCRPHRQGFAAEEAAHASCTCHAWSCSVIAVPALPAFDLFLACSFVCRFKILWYFSMHHASAVVVIPNLMVCGLHAPQHDLRP